MNSVYPCFDGPILLIPARYQSGGESKKWKLNTVYRDVLVLKYRITIIKALPYLKLGGMPCMRFFKVLCACPATLIVLKGMYM